MSETERAKRMRRAADEATAEEMRRLQESGEISHLYGRPLDLDDDPNWLVTRTLKQQGFSHPVIERSRELDEPRKAVATVEERLRRRGSRLVGTAGHADPARAAAFNQWRDRALGEYREKLLALNRAIRDFNLQSPDALHQRPIVVDEAVERLAREVSPAEIRSPGPPDTEGRRSLWRRLRGQ